MRRGLVLALSVTILAALGVGSAPAAPADQQAVKRIGIINFDYRPDPQTVAPGETVRVGNGDGFMNGIPHSLTSEDDLFDTGVFVCCVRSIVAPNNPGVYPYRCDVHDRMSGTLVVSG
jgi:plastocyanin